MEFYEIVLAIAVLATGMVAGLFFTFSMLIMPGLSSLKDREYIKAFQAIDRILQSNAPAVGTQPFFAVVFFGAMAALVAALILGFGYLDAMGLMLIGAAVLVYGIGMLLPTGMVNLPLNNKIQTYDADAMSEQELKAARLGFEPRWNRANMLRTVASTTTAALLVALMVQL